MEGENPVLDSRTASMWCDFYESVCLGMQTKMGGKYHLKLNIGERPIANKYREGKMKRTLKRELNSTWNCQKGTVMNQYWCLKISLFERKGALFGFQVNISLFRGKRVTEGSPSGCYSRDGCHGMDWGMQRFLGFPHQRLGCLTKWFLTTRLETRTKESNTCASIWVSNPFAKWKWTRWEICTIDLSGSF